MFKPKLYGFFLIAAMLAGYHMGGWTQRLFLIALGLGILSLTYTVITYFSLRFYQEFSTDHPQKGSVIIWTLKITNPLWFWTPALGIHGFPTPGISGRTGPGTIPPMKPKETMVWAESISCNYRGVYKLGLEHLEVRDILFGFSLKLPIHERTFYVLPQVYHLSQGTPNTRSKLQTNASKDQGTLSAEAASLKGLSEYSPGYPLSRIHWKALARYDRPIISQYDGRSNRLALIYLDPRGIILPSGVPAPTDWRVPAEDCAVETFFSLLQGHEDLGRPWVIQVPGWTHSTTHGSTHKVSSTRHGIKELLIQSNSMFFQESGNPLVDIESHPALRQVTELYFVSTIADGRFISMAKRISYLGGRAILCAAGYPSDHPGLLAIRNLSKQYQQRDDQENPYVILDTTSDIPKKVVLP
jgi:hypothetical protein